MTERSDPRQCGPYRVERLLGRGGMGAVFRARHRETGARYALKVILVERMDEERAARALARFRREVEVLARVEGDGTIVRVHETGLHDGRPWCVMDLVQGRPLDEILRADGALPPHRAAELVAVIARALHGVHRADVVHRDLKPGNVLIEETGRPRLVDFGIAYDAVSSRLTRTGDAVGTPSFMAPEQIDSDPDAIGPATDVYGLGALLYTCLTARPPFPGEVYAALRAIVAGEPRSPRAMDPAVPAALDAVCLRAMARAPAERYPDALALAEDLERFGRGERILGARPSRRAGPLVGAAVLVAIAAIVAVASLGGRAVDPEQRLARIEAALTARGSLSPDEAALLASLDADSPSEPSLAGRVRAARALDALARDEAASVAELARLVRADPALRSVVGEAALAGGRAAALARILHDAEPILVVAPERAVAVAEAVAAGLADPPGDAVAFRALYHARGLPDGARGRLLVRRAEVGLARGELDVAEAVDLLASASRDHGVRGPVILTEEGYVALAAAFADAAEAGLLDDARRMAWVASRVPDQARPDVLPIDLLARFVESTIAPEPERLDESLELGSIFLSFLVPAGNDVTRPSNELLVNLFGLERFVRLARATRARPVEMGDAVGLAYTAAVVLGSEKGRARWRDEALEWVEDALAFEPRGRRLLVLAARALRSAGEGERALELSRAALAVDRALPDERRWPLIIHAAADFEPDPRRAARLLGEAMRIQRVRDVQLPRFAAAGLPPPEPWAHHSDIGSSARDVASKLIRDEGRPCCELEVSPGAAELLEMAIAHTMNEYARHRMWRTQARHLLRHDRPIDALEAARRSVDVARVSVVAESGLLWERRLAEGLLFRAEILRSLGRDRDAALDEERAEELRRGRW